MNKGRRNELKQLKYKKRVSLYGAEFTALKSHSTPCSCGICRGEKYRNKDRQKNKVIDYD